LDPDLAEAADIGCEKASPAAGIYLAGIGGLLAAAGGFQMRNGPGRRDGFDGPEATRVCPDCAETVLAAARVCRYCGHNFSAAAGPSPGGQASSGTNSWEWRCELCRAQFMDRVAAEKHAENDHIEMTTEQAKQSLRRRPG
jgi:hypothetical protein